MCWVVLSLFEVAFGQPAEGILASGYICSFNEGQKLPKKYEKVQTKENQGGSLRTIRL